MNVITGLGYMLVSLVCIMLSVYIALCFISWITDVIDDRKRRIKKSI